MVPEDVLLKAKDMLESATRPLFLYDNDCDGLCAFVVCYQFCKEGKGVPVTNRPYIDEQYLRKIREYQPDLIVVLDVANLEESFLEEIQTPILWIDHHEPSPELVKKFPNVLHVNPRIWDDEDNLPATYWAYKITRTNLWLATIGTVADWHIPEFIDEFKEQYGDLLPETFEMVEQLYLDTPIGQIIKILQFNLKGPLSEVRKSVLTLTRIESPYEILQQSTSRGRFLWKKYKRLADSYAKHIAEARRVGEESDTILLFAYADSGNTFTAEISNELLIRFPEKVIIVARKHDGKMKCSFRSKNTSIPEKLAEALKDVDGYGGGHKNACGGVISEEDWDRFYKKFSELFTAS